MISHEKKFVFVHIPRTAGTSVDTALKKYSEEYVKHEDIRVIKSKIRDNLDNYFKFCTVRNPWDWIVSLYFWGIQIASSKLNRPYWNNLNFKEWIIHEFVNKIDRFNPEKQLRTQMKWIVNKHNDIAVDYICRFENIKQDWNVIREKLNIEDELPHVYNTTRQNYKDYYDTETKKIIENVYIRDIEEFKYRF